MDQMELRLSARQAVSKAEIMAREIDHRVKNSLQFVSTLLNMQCRAPDVAAAASEQLRIAANRVVAVARVHQNFFTEAAEAVSSIEFLRRLCAELSGILVPPIIVDGDEGDVPTERIQPIGLIVNEHVTNGAKHGAEAINVTYRINGDMHELSVRDDGVGLPAGFDPENHESGLGMKVVRSLASLARRAGFCGPQPGGTRLLLYGGLPRLAAWPSPSDAARTQNAGVHCRAWDNVDTGRRLMTGSLSI
jgi:two-component sensor histidine kinase